MEPHVPRYVADQRPNFLFSFIFACTFLLITQLFSMFALIYNLILFPFTLIHELGHFIALCCLFPGKEPQIEFHLLENGISNANVRFEQLPLCWGSVISFLIGPLSILIVSLFGIVVLRKYFSSSLMGQAGNQFFKFVMLCDIPNLFPIHPPLIGAATDGYSASVYLFLMGYVPFVSLELSIILYGIASIVAFTAFYCLGSAVYFLLQLSKVRILNENRGSQPQIS